MKICIIIPYEDAERMTRSWACEESAIDFRRDSKRANRCTTAFAATELEKHLLRTLLKTDVAFSSEGSPDAFCIRLIISDTASESESFRIECTAEGLRIIGHSRIGVIYGVYEFLRMQGWRWYIPGDLGEIAPEYTDNLVLPEEVIESSPSMPLGRGFDFEGVSKESVNLLLWMVRNRLNLCGYRFNTSALGKKLGMSLKSGGHVFEEILDPERPMSSGKTLWEEHQEWYGLPADGIRKKETAQRTQFCVSQLELIEFLGEELLKRIMGEWNGADRIDVWGFDTWGNTCSCERCHTMGNSSDQALYFLSAIRGFLDQARSDGRLDHDVRLVTAGYEGTTTIAGPERPVPQNLIDAGDYVTFYPILRCYAHDFHDAACSQNRKYDQDLSSWFGSGKNLPVMIGEYYNVSKFEDLPLLFTKRIGNDLPYYHSAGSQGITYMHIPLVNWGMRTLTQLLYAQLAWDMNTDVEFFVDEYFKNWYGPYSQRMRKVYELVEEAWAMSASWRSWDKSSVLSRLRDWDGSKPESPLELDDHFGTSAIAVENGRRYVLLLEEAMSILSEVRNEDQSVSAHTVPVMNVQAVNPIEARKAENAGKYDWRLGENYRSMIYGIDTMKLMTELVAYHDALFHGNSRQAEEAWQIVDQTAKSLDSYYIPIGYEWPGAGIESRDGLTRSQLREVLSGCRRHRLDRH